MASALNGVPYIESYDKIGYEINIENSAIQPKDDFIKDFYELVGLHMLLFRASVMYSSLERTYFLSFKVSVVLTKR